MIIQLAVTGLMVGMVYALMALGIVVIYKCSSVFNFAHGAIVAFMCYVAWAFLVQMSLPLWVTAALLVVSAVVLGWIIQVGVLRPLIGQPLLASVMVTLALMQVFGGLVTLIWPGPARFYPPIIPTGSLNLAGAVISYESLISLGVCILVFLAFLYFFQGTKLGLALRGTAEDHQLARSNGIRVVSMFTLAWIIAIITCSVGGVLVGNMHGVNYEPVSGLAMKALPAVMIGGMESIVGALLGGLLIGFFETIGAGFLDPLVGGGFADVFPYIAMIALIIFKPYGLFGYEKIERV